MKMVGRSFVSSQKNNVSLVNEDYMKIMVDECIVSSAKNKVSLTDKAWMKMSGNSFASSVKKKDFH